MVVGVEPAQRGDTHQSSISQYVSVEDSKEEEPW